MPRKKGDLHKTLAVLDALLSDTAKLLVKHAKELAKANDAVETEVRRAQALLGGSIVVRPESRPQGLVGEVAVRMQEEMQDAAEEAPRAREEEAELMKAAMQKAGVAPREETLAERQAREQQEYLNSVRPGRATQRAPRTPATTPDLPGPVIEPSAREDLT